MLILENEIYESDQTYKYEGFLIFQWQFADSLDEINEETRTFLNKYKE